MTTPDPLIGATILGRYRITRFLAKGGMGAIYLARNEGAAGFVKPVVIKRILPDLLGDALTAKLFAREARIMSHLRHPGIVSVVDFAHEDGAYVMVLEYIHGYHLGRWYRFIKRSGSHFPAELAVHIVISVLDALHYAHTLVGPDGTPFHIIHRDIKPSNILIGVEGRVKLADFGIARMESDRTDVSSRATIKGTFSYLAPEILQGGDPSAATDLYACAVLLHELLTGRNEFAHQDMRAVVARVLDHVPTPIDEIRKSVSPALRDAVAKGLEKNPVMRYKTAAEFAAALRATRKLSTEEANDHLAQRATQDFNDPLIARLLQTDDLSTLERSWRTPAPSQEKSEIGERAPMTAENPTVVDQSSHAMMLRREVPRSHGKLWLALGGLAVAAGLGVAIMWALKFGDAKPAQYIVVQRGQVAPDDPTAGWPDAGKGHIVASTADATPTRDPKARAGVANGHVRKPKAKPLLARAFREKSAAIRACFDRHAESTVGTPQIAVRFHVAASGKVLAAELVPESVSTTPLGQCLLGVAKSTQFGELGGDVKFRIPIKVRSKKG